MKEPKHAPSADLYIGMKLYGHDVALFAVEPTRKLIFGISAERLTRYKHDDMPSALPLKRMVKYLELDTSSIRRIVVSSSFTSQDNDVFDLEHLSSVVELRKIINAKYSGEFKEKISTFSALPIDEKIKLLDTTPGGKKIKQHGFTNQPYARSSFRDYAINMIRDEFPNAEIIFSSYDHEYCHAVSSYFSYTYDKALAITMDGMGDPNIYSRIYLVEKGRFIEVAHSDVPQIMIDFGAQAGTALMSASLGGIYSWFTHVLGYDRHSDPGKVEALAAFGEPIPELLDDLLQATPLDLDAGAIRLDVERVAKVASWDRLNHYLNTSSPQNLAATVQTYLEAVMLPYVKALTEKFGEKRLLLSGGVFANVILNLKIFEQISEDIFIVPAMSDDGSAQGACYLGMLDNGCTAESMDWIRNAELPYFGTSYSREDVWRELEPWMDRVNVQDLGDGWPEVVAEMLFHESVGAIFQGRMEWGPRALGNRSIIADPRLPDIRDRLNQKIKKRPSFQPFCPSILDTEMERLFDHYYRNLHMTCAFRMKEEHWGKLPAAIHVDGTARAQIVEPDTNPGFYRLIRRFKELSGYGIVINTSFNKHGRTIVESTADAVTDFMDTDLPFLCIEGFLVTRKN